MKIKILFVASEVTPLAKVGGLGDVVGALPKALSKLGVDVRIITGYYGTHDEKTYPTSVIGKIFVPWNSEPLPAKIRKTVIPKSRVPVYLIDQPQVVSTGGIYDSPTAIAGSEAEVERFLFISKAAVLLPEIIKFKPDVWHLHDWHAAPVTLFLKPPHAPTLLTIHNLANQGWASSATIARAGLSVSGAKNFNLFRAGLEKADYLSTVSPTYAKEIQSAPGGEGLEDILRRRRQELTGIVNGIDTQVFNPATDRCIARRYDARHLERKFLNTTALRRLGGLDDIPGPVFGIVSRFTNQKGVDILSQAIEPFIKSKRLQFVFLGQGEKSLEDLCLGLAKLYPKFCFGKIGFDAVLAQKIYAGSDFFLMPSRFEPCGLGQLIAMRYGTIPIVRATGGLKDTVVDIAQLGGTGLVFNDFSAAALSNAIDRALALYGNRAKLKTVRRRAMRHDFSWEASAKEYLKLYKHLMK
ncbi:hypothetical protein A3I40_03750 [Candidatus Uhrbacteria bacterium RIFCSPLOWO2_02_FULL_48_12]|uniref:Glycogen synthase n=1 Tax=Candidatus Uhrbacteria bacterium RIFCSPLOWO2_02_FULL_48_12 TaxID=1802407 RepID=A0A1F7VAZ9_9BACT|nr:MAG: hypothetical protein A3I40_03750 [Candidatus Uhrbacteria bacterium RIFCSPLOWO2_02_FULL_48_12]